MLIVVCHIYKRVKPILIDSTEDESNEPVKQRLKGHLVHFGNTKPSFWIKVLSVTGEYNNQSFSAKLTDITHQPYIINKPMVISPSIRINRFGAAYLFRWIVRLSK